MKITPLDIQQKQFQTTFRGLHQQEVMAFLDMVRLEMETLMRENAQLKDNMRKQEAELADYKERDKAVKDTLILAQRMTEDIKRSATREAEIVLSEARLQGEQIMSNAHDRMLQILEEINELKAQRSQMLASLRATVETHGKLLQITENQLHDRDNMDEKMAYLRRGSGGLERAR